MGVNKIEFIYTHTKGWAVTHTHTHTPLTLENYQALYVIHIQLGLPLSGYFNLPPSLYKMSIYIYIYITTLVTKSSCTQQTVWNALRADWDWWTLPVAQLLTKFEVYADACFSASNKTPSPLPHASRLHTSICGALKSVVEVWIAFSASKYKTTQQQPQSLHLLSRCTHRIQHLHA